MGFPTVYDTATLNEDPFLVIFGPRTNFSTEQEVGTEKWWVTSVHIQYEGICLSTLAEKVEQTTTWTDKLFQDSSSTDVEKIPILIAGSSAIITTDVVNYDIPLLLSNESMRNPKLH